MDINSKEEFIYFMQRACEDQSNDCYIELYNILLRCFFFVATNLNFCQWCNLFVLLLWNFS